MKQKLTLYFLCAGAVFACLGCVPLIVGAAAGAGGISYFKGAYEKNFDKPLEQVYRATVNAIIKQSMTITKEKVQKHSAVVEFSSNNGKSGKIEITALTERASKISVRVGLFGDEALSRIILNSVEANL